MAPSLMNLSVLADYAVRYDYYVNVLCENKEEPNSMCHGKCQLAMAEQANTEEEPAIPTLKEVEIEVFFYSESEQGNIFSEEQTNHRLPFIENGLLDAYLLPDLKPPRV